MTTPWAHLPNAIHIDWVIASVRDNLAPWEAARNATWNARWDVLRDEARAEAMHIVSFETWNAVRKSAEVDMLGLSPWCAIVALMTYDDCAYLISSRVEEVRILANLGCPKAILLLPACIVYNSL